MSYSKRMLDTYPRIVALDADVLAAAIEALHDCAQACAADVDADLSEPNLTDMVKCIRLCLHCADLCTATAAVASNPTHPQRGDDARDANLGHCRFAIRG